MKIIGEGLRKTDAKALLSWWNEHTDGLHFMYRDDKCYGPQRKQNLWCVVRQ